MNKEQLSKKVGNMLKRYVKNPSKRCKTSEGCRYSGKTLGLNTPGCVIGAALPPNTRSYLDKRFPDKNLNSIIYEGVFLPSFIKDNSNLFIDLQRLHDDDRSWTKGGLSKEGEIFLRQAIVNNGLSSEIIGDIIGVAL